MDDEGNCVRERNREIGSWGKISFGNVRLEHGKEERRGTSDDIVDEEFFLK